MQPTKPLTISIGIDEMPLDGPPPADELSCSLSESQSKLRFFTQPVPLQMSIESCSKEIFSLKKCPMQCCSRYRHSRFFKNSGQIDGHGILCLSVLSFVVYKYQISVLFLLLFSLVVVIYFFYLNSSSLTIILFCLFRRVN